jgi:xanthine dehydrogenase/oxidase
VTSERAHAKILNVDASKALKVDGVIAFYWHKDVPGSNMWGEIVYDEEIFASKEVVHYGLLLFFLFSRFSRVKLTFWVEQTGQPIGVIIAKDPVTAKHAAKLVEVQYEDLPSIFSIDEAIKANSFFEGTLNIKDGDVDAAFKEVDKVIEGEIYIGGQEHFYFEPHVTIAVPNEVINKEKRKKEIFSNVFFSFDL